MDIRRAITFIEENGSDLERARFQHLLYGAKPQAHVVRSFTELQNEDGGFPCGMVRGNPGCVHKTVTALWWLDELGMLASPTAGSALSYLLAVQKGDGGWDEDPALVQYGLPPWITPGDPATRCYLSAYALYWLALGGHGSNLAFQKGLHFLLQQRDEMGRLPDVWHSTWIATSVFYMAGPQYVKTARQGFRVLMESPLSEWVDSQICWALDCLGRAGVPKDQPFIEDALAELRGRQAADGSWASEDGAAFAVGATIEALKVLKLYGLLPGGQSAD